MTDVPHPVNPAPAHPPAGEILLRRGKTIAVAESLTAGMVCAALADTPGISAILRGSITAYATELKASLLGVDADLLAASGPVHPEVAAQMARGVADRLGASLAVSTTGVAGPGPADGHQAGTVWIGREDGRAYRLAFPGSRSEVRKRATDAALSILAEDIPAEVVEVWE